MSGPSAAGSAVPRRAALGARLRSDKGSAPIEFVFASVVLLIPLVYLVVALAQLQAGAYAAHASAVDAARAAATHPDSAEARAAGLAQLHFADFGLADVDYSLTRECAGPCDEAGTLVTAHVEAAIPIPGVPVLFGGRAGHITIHAEHSDLVAEEVGTAADASIGGAAAAGHRADGAAR
ncbi:MULTISPECIES: hypothetical protein [Brevibacterium]|uniref:hypothetical protein n=1 Tax=Brevibacterium TaxID=1696 RepID=UPI00192824E3|nr:MULTISPECIES: hypothetical protein [Brevibacterium]WAL40213.1 hypothetical protein BRM1_13465 [Brevibacterium sp. BRM-1]